MNTKTSKKDELRAAFNEAYASLNAAQKQAVDAIEGPVLVVAGPGTGKTQILTLRIANILLTTDTKPEQILALTFTESGAKAMRERLRRYVGAAAYRVPIHTFHSFAGRLIAEYPDAYPDIVGGRPASDIDILTILETILDTPDLSVLRPRGNPQYYVRPLKSMLQTLKQENISPDALGKIIAVQEAQLADTQKLHEKGAHKGKVRGEYSTLEKVIAKNRELLTVYRQYQALLRERRLFDFDDMIKETVTALENDEEMLRDLQEQYQYLLADEHQDVNGAQNRILELLASYHSSPNIFAVGDEKQAIYRFQGASLENFLYFEDVFANTTTIALIENYRSGQTVLDAAHSLIEVEDGPLAALRVPLTAAAVDNAVVEKRLFSHQAVEDEWVVEKVKGKLAAGTPAVELAIIVRTNQEVETFAALLRKHGVPAAPSADGDILRHPITQAVRALLSAVVARSDEAALFAVLHGAYWGLSSTDVTRICSARRYDTPLSSLLADRAKLEALGVLAIDEAMKVGEVLETARAKEVTDPPHRVLEYLLEASGFIAHITKHDPLEGVRVVRRLYDEIETLVLQEGINTLQAVNELLVVRESYGLPLNAPYVHTNPSAVSVMTAHKSKGLEFSVVLAPRLVDAVWGGSVRRELFKVPLTKNAALAEGDRIDDEKRLLYVVMTRAKTELYLSYSNTNAAGKELTGSRLLEEVSDESVATVDVSQYENEFDITTTLTSTVAPMTIDPVLLTTLLTERGFSATSLNNYLKNPWDYFYRNVLRIPEVQPAHMQFGTAIHNTLEKITRHHTKHNALPEETAIVSWYETELSRLPLSQTEFGTLREDGVQTLLSYLNHLEATLPATTYEELNIRVLLQTGLPELPELPLTGKLDRLDIGPDGRAFRVVDYKTGKAKSRNVIEGKTASSDGGYKRQLVFYALLLSLYDDERFKTRDGVLSFVQADQKGAIKEELFSITQAEIDELTQEIVAAAKSIVSGDFLNDTEAAAGSEYANLVAWLYREQSK